MPPKKRKAAETLVGQCKDCPPGSKRPSPYPGPRCATHHREIKKQRKGASRDPYLRRTYNLTEDQYNEILESQGGTCFICGPITGRNGSSKNLSVDHDHKCCSGSKSCGKCVRAILCGNCNRYILGHLRDDVDALMRAIQVIQEHPAQGVLTNHPARKVVPRE